VKTIDVAGMKTDPAARLAIVEELVGFDANDRAALRDSVAVLGPVLPQLLDAVYDHLLAFDDTKKFFLGTTGEVDAQYLAIRKEHLTTWVLGVTVDRRPDPEYAAWMHAIAEHHAGRGPRSRRVPPRWLVTLTGWLQGRITEALFAADLADPNDLRRYVLAWNKLLVVQLEMFLHVVVPSFPGWDEGPDG
jgi:hypothetical protein